MKKFLCYDTNDAVSGKINVDNRGMLKPNSTVPSGSTPYQQLVTDGDGNAKWEDRLAYEKAPVETVFLEETTVNFEDADGTYLCEAPPFFAPSVGETYGIVWDGTVYQCACFDFGDQSALGNLSVIDAGDDTGEPFVFLIHAEHSLILTKDNSQTHTISVSGYVTPIVKIPAKFIDKDSSGYIAIHSDAAMTKQEAQRYSNALLANKLVFIIWGGLCIKDINFGGTTGYDLQLRTQTSENYLITKNDDNLYYLANRKFSSAMYPRGIRTGDEGVSISFNRKYASVLPGTVHSGVGSTDIVFNVRTNGTESKDFNVLGNGEAVTQAVILYSSTSGSTKQFRITVDDTGIISATEVTT